MAKDPAPRLHQQVWDSENARYEHLLDNLWKASTAVDEALCALELAVREAREGGLPWQMIAQPLGVTTQAAWKRWR